MLWGEVFISSYLVDNFLVSSVQAWCSCMDQYEQNQSADNKYINKLIVTINYEE